MQDVATLQIPGYVFQRRCEGPIIAGNRLDVVLQEATSRSEHGIVERSTFLDIMQSNSGKILEAKHCECVAFLSVSRFTFSASLIVDVKVYISPAGEMHLESSWSRCFLRAAELAKIFWSLAVSGPL
jgi:hypothetical protein